MLTGRRRMAFGGEESFGRYMLLPLITVFPPDFPLSKTYLVVQFKFCLLKVLPNYSD